jgi:hypothetical protein
MLGLPSMIFPFQIVFFFFPLPCWVMGGPGTPNDWKAPDPEVDFILVRCLVQKSGMFHPKLVPDFAAANPQATPIWLDDFPVQPQFGSIILPDFRAIDSRRIYLFLSLVMFLSSVAIVGSCCGLWIGQIFDEMHVFP